MTSPRLRRVLRSTGRFVMNGLIGSACVWVGPPPEFWPRPEGADLSPPPTALSQHEQMVWNSLLERLR
ncbi:hypothetical protein [Kineosporia babensis]|uniref:Uncharacterized protein n=1 Tax=Kineosporia babensis TaxID=499548 RepID=A0A9X1SX12_9ACTN|nr:hypothetical protein [Kineosporia babensis]MCD5315702.1 hypothetical protein [Kineosporia babensis]